MVSLDDFVIEISDVFLKMVTHILIIVIFVVTKQRIEMHA